MAQSTGQKKEVDEWKAKYMKSTEDHKQIQMILNEYEKTMAKMIGTVSLSRVFYKELTQYITSLDDAQKEREKHEVQQQRLVAQNKRLQTQVDAMEVSFKELRVRYEENRSEMEKSKKVRRFIMLVWIVWSNALGV